MKKLSFYLLPFITFITSCTESTCYNSNTMYDIAHYNDEAYKAALSAQLSSSPEESFNYNLVHFFSKQGNDYMVVEVHNDKGLCAKAQVLCDHTEVLDGIRETKGMGYRGAGLKGLKFKARKQNDTICFIMTDLKSIID